MEEIDKIKSEMHKSIQNDITSQFLNGMQGRVDSSLKEIEKAKQVVLAAQEKADKFLLAVDLLVASTEGLLLVQKDGEFCYCPMCVATRHSLEEVKELMKGYKMPGSG